MPGDSPVNLEQAAGLLENISKHDLARSEKEAVKKYAAKVDKDRITNGQWVYSAGHAVLMHNNEVVQDNNDHPIQVSLEDLAALHAGTITVEELREKRKQAGKVPVMTLSGPQGTIGRDQSAEHTPSMGQKFAAWMGDKTIGASVETFEEDREARLAKVVQEQYGGVVPEDQIIDAKRFQEQKENPNSFVQYGDPNLSVAEADYIDQYNAKLMEEKLYKKEVWDARGMPREDIIVDEIINLADPLVQLVSKTYAISKNVGTAVNNAATREERAPLKYGREEKLTKD